MIEQLPIYVAVTFGMTTVFALLIFHMILVYSKSEKINKNAIKITSCLAIWLLIQAIITLQNYYNSNTNILPPRIFLYGILPSFIAILALFLTKKGRYFMDNVSLKHLTLIHVLRIPVEFVLWWLYIYKCVPELMTFEGRNFDILAGITAPLIAYFGFSKVKLSKKFILFWNIICLGLLINIVVNGFLSAPSPLQKFAFDQPNIALFYFPFSWLVSFIVPLVLLAHLIAIRKLLKSNLK